MPRRRLTLRRTAEEVRREPEDGVLHAPPRDRGDRPEHAGLQVRSRGRGVELDEFFVPENFKGNHDRSVCGLPRKARKRKGRGRDGREQISVLTGTNEVGDIFYEMTGRGPMDAQRARTRSRTW